MCFKREKDSESGIADSGGRVIGREVGTDKDQANIVTSLEEVQVLFGRFGREL